MKYGILGQDHNTPEEKIEKFTGQVDWPYLKPHLENGTMIYLDPSLDLDTVAQALIQDNTQQVQTWMKTGDLTKPSAPHAAIWEKTNPRFQVTIVSPFALAQIIK